MKNNYFLRTILFALLFSLGALTTRAQLYINEIVQSNLNLLMDDWNEYPDSWVELYNAGTQSVNIEGYGIGTKSKFSSSYLLPPQVIAPKGYLIIYCDKGESDLHTDFRVESGSKGNLYLFDAAGNQIDAVTNMAEMPSPDVAYGRTQDGGDTWSYLITATPGKSNNTATPTDVILPRPEFSIEGGLFTSAIGLSISKPADAPLGTVVRYTTNGNEPTVSSPILAEGATINITRTTIVRAKLFAPNAIACMSTPHSYIFHGRKVTLPVVSIISNYDNFYGDKIGIYTTGSYNPHVENFRYDWRRPINIELFDTDNYTGLNQLCETRVSGNASRDAPMKSLTVYSNKRFGTKQFDYPLFPDKPQIPIKSFIMRNSGNDFCWSHFRDVAIQLICARGGMDLDWHANPPSIWYLTGP